uniref:Uncharacterized protein n=1 Tax=Timema douglasi TaxID=61478 RepID=A0A7R8VK49_TIMDO|nr:unnamed protein product [Timema douglasi]
MELFRQPAEKKRKKNQKDVVDKEVRNKQILTMADNVLKKPKEMDEYDKYANTVAVKHRTMGTDKRLLAELSVTVVPLGGVLIGLFLLQGVHMQVPMSCPGLNSPDYTVHIAHPNDCSLFYKCDNGQPRLQECPQGLNFNPTLQVCDWPWSAGCKAVPASNYSSSSTSTPPRQTTPLPVSGAPCPTAGTCPDEDDPLDAPAVLLPHLTACGLYCRCVNRKPNLEACPEGLHFNVELQQCDWPQDAKCQGACPKLVNLPGSTWYPETCVSDLSSSNDTCNLACSSGYELSGSSVVECTDDGWSGTGGIGVIPSCKTPEQLGEDFIDKINKTLFGVNASMLFLLDESGSVAPFQFEMEKTFAEAIVNAFPLSETRTAGVISFDHNAFVDIELTESSTCDFERRVKAITYSGGGTDIEKVLNNALSEVNILVTDGVSSTDPTVVASLLKSSGDNILFTIGVASYSRDQLEPLSSLYTDGSTLFFGISSFQVFDVISSYLKTAYNTTAVQCP